MNFLLGKKRPTAKRCRARKSFIWVAVFLLFSSPAWSRPLYVGTIGPDPAQEINRLQPLTRYLEQELSSVGVDRVRIVVAKNIPSMMTLFKQKGVDIFLGGAFPAVGLSRRSASRMVLQGGGEGSDRMASVFFVRKDGELKRLRDLKGEIVAFDNPSSTFGYWLPKALLLEKGYRLVPKKNFSDAVGPDEVGYLFSHDGENTVLWVQKGKVKAGATDQSLFRSEEKRDPELRVLEKTVSIPAKIVNLRSDLSSKLGRKIEEAFLKMDQSEEGKRALRALEDTTRFEPVSNRALEPLLKSADLIDSEIKNSLK